jgi:hypothetical protein
MNSFFNYKSNNKENNVYLLSRKYTNKQKQLKENLSMLNNITNISKIKRKTKLNNKKKIKNLVSSVLKTKAGKLNSIKDPNLRSIPHYFFNRSEVQTVIPSQDRQ